MRKRLTLIAIGAALAVAVPTLAVAAFPESDVKSYTGCLSLTTGQISGVAEGDTAKFSCAGTMVAIHLSGGDITAARTPEAGGLQGGTENGGANLALQPGYKLPQSCANGQVAKANAGTWNCDNDIDTNSGGDITGVNTPPGSGLTGGASSGEVNLGLGATFKLPQACSQNQVTKWIGSAWACANDNDTTYTGANFATSNQSCTGAQFTKGIGSNGALQCADTPAASAGSLQSFRVAGSTLTLGSLDAGTSVASCPSGSVVTGGGYTESGVEISFNRQRGATTPGSETSENSWVVIGSTPFLGGGNFTAYATCTQLVP